ncbi:MAG TPA: hypothetical protein VJQ08_06120 [Candidatus Dormibacteraeota bacterium]|nr:hypothetical protein [Candidatus Dormibacteraeota bacterium]
MIPAAYQNFVIASTQASAALIGLLFVAITLAPERVFGEQAESGRQARALSAFTALANIFFISFSILIPDVNVGLVVTLVGGVSILQTLGLLLLLRHWSSQGVLWRSLFLFLGSLAIYGGEIAVGVQIWNKPANPGALSGILELLLGAFAIGLGRAWEILGAPRMGFVSRLLERLDRGTKPPPGKPPQSGG